MSYHVSSIQSPPHYLFQMVRLPASVTAIPRPAVMDLVFIIHAVFSSSSPFLSSVFTQVYLLETKRHATSIGAAFAIVLPSISSPACQKRSGMFKVVMGAAQTTPRPGYSSK
jgi:hypothetical protein